LPTGRFLQEKYGEGLKMTKRFMAAIVIAGILGLPAMAHPEWGHSSVSTHYQWEVRTAGCSPIDVRLHVVRWADVYFADNDNQQIELVQIGADIYAGCVDLEVCVNFEGLKIMAQYSEDIYLGADTKYFISLVPTGNAPIYNEDNTSFLISTMHLTGNSKPVTLCVKITGVDPATIPIGNQAGQTYKVGHIDMTMVPIGSPP
jgi:hypothetical protein